MSGTSTFLEQYEPLDVIGNGSFGIIRKVKRKQDETTFARKEIDFERMNERDRKQVVAEVNILKDLDHAHIVRYHDRHVDRDAGILYILMEYCGGGDLSSVIKQAQKHNRLIPEETIWHYFMQILLALHYCHHPNGNTRSSGSDGEGKERRAPILHRDLKPDNVFLDENNSVKLGDFGLSKVLTQASLASTYVGTPYYMSPELMQEKSYDSKSDICNGRIPPLPRGYSQALSAVIKAMLNLNPSIRPSAAQLLQHERIEFAYKVFETQKQLDSVKTHKSSLVERERELVARESALVARETAQNAVISQKDSEIAALQTQLTELVASIATQMEQAVAAREVELRRAVLEYEKVVELRVQRREEEVMEAVRVREAELCEAWQRQEVTLRAACEAELEERWRIEHNKLKRMKDEIEEKARAIEESQQKGQKKEKTPLEEVKNILAPLAQLTRDPQSTPRPNMTSPTRSTRRVILTATGESLETPTPTKFVDLLLTDSPRVGGARVGAGGSLGFAKIFDFDRLDEEEESGDENGGGVGGGKGSTRTPRSPSKRKAEAVQVQVQVQAQAQAPTLTRANSAPRSPSKRNPTPPSQSTGRFRRPSVSSRSRNQSQSQGSRTKAPAAADAPNLEDSTVTPSSSTSSTSFTSFSHLPPPLLLLPVAVATPMYDLHDEENLPSPFLRRIEREGGGAGSGSGGAIGMMMAMAQGKCTYDDNDDDTRLKRPSGANLLRVAAAANNAKAAVATTTTNADASAKVTGTGTVARSSSSMVVKRAGGEARKALLRM
ncbi:kinase-like domain-containing protein [Multifurca ochricompacta]|uniref:non-specific serine/threonine protein kinase n=1 Tax=Multifurca ochricompacta TaxID=376703 RepID=A0AAD4LUX8_9AGAM|nr:kinase-like domain-containing protein [Multifurca ochricompacta]